jgi:hypothetical protein
MSKTTKRVPRHLPLPVATFADLATFGLAVHVWCLRCHTMRSVEIPADRLSRRFTDTRFRCQACGAPGYPSFRSSVSADDGGPITDLYCGKCLPPWEMRNLRLDLPPWSAFTLGSGQVFARPGCRRPVLMHVRAAETHWGAIGGHLHN